MTQEKCCEDCAGVYYKDELKRITFECDTCPCHQPPAPEKLIKCKTIHLDGVCPDDSPAPKAWEDDFDKFFNSLNQEQEVRRVKVEIKAFIQNIINKLK